MLLSLILLALPIQWDDLPALIRRHLPVTQTGFPDYRQAIDADTTRRVQEGEREHLVYFLLQSKSFTRQPPVEPALSRQSPEIVHRRFQDYLSGQTITPTPRLTYFRQHVPIAESGLAQAYDQAMTFLDRMDYSTRAHSSDTSLAASYTAATAIAVLKALNPKFLPTRVLIVGPGADFAPRTAFDETRPPQSYQPYAIAAALGPTVEIDCADVNGRVLATISNRKPAFRQEAGTADFLDYQRTLTGATVQPRLTPTPLNIVTQRLTQKYDLILATNILLYFQPAHLALALTNIQAMLAPGGYFIHNDTRPETGLYAAELRLSTLQARRLLIAQGPKAPLYDFFAILSN